MGWGEEHRVTNPTTGGQKGSKLARFDLIPPRSLTALAEHFGKGAEKYAARNWERGVDWSLNYAALMRHMTQWWGGEDVDEEGNSHLAAAMWHSTVLIEYAETHPELDDRPSTDWVWGSGDYEAKKAEEAAWYKEQHDLYEQAAEKHLLQGNANEGWTEQTENGMTYTFILDEDCPKGSAFLINPAFVHSDGPNTFEDLLASDEHRKWNDRQKARCAEWQKEWDDKWKMEQ